MQKGNSCKKYKRKPMQSYTFPSCNADGAFLNYATTSNVFKDCIKLTSPKDVDDNDRIQCPHCQEAQRNFHMFSLETGDIICIFCLTPMNLWDKEKTLRGTSIEKLVESNWQERLPHCDKCEPATILYIIDRYTFYCPTCKITIEKCDNHDIRLMYENCLYSIHKSMENLNDFKPPPIGLYCTPCSVRRQEVIERKNKKSITID